MTIAKVVKDKILGKSKGFNCPIKLATFALKKDERMKTTQATMFFQLWQCACHYASFCLPRYANPVVH